MSGNVLILGGTAEAYDLACRLAEDQGLTVTTALAGRTRTPRVPAGTLRLGGFGGTAGLAAWLSAHAIDAVIDATHPFAARMGANAAQACLATNTDLLRLERPAWHPGDGDHWHRVSHWPQAVAYTAATARRALLAVGRQELAPFAGLDQVRFLIRLIEIPDPWPNFAHAEIIAARGPFTIDAEIALLQAHGIDTIICKNSGGPTDAKLHAARHLKLQVIMVDRPPRPQLPLAADVAQAVAWLYRRDQPAAPTKLP